MHICTVCILPSTGGKLWFSVYFPVATWTLLSWSTMSSSGYAADNSSIVHALLKPMSSAMSFLYSCPITSTCLSWYSVRSRAGVGACITWFGSTCKDNNVTNLSTGHWTKFILKESIEITKRNKNRNIVKHCENRAPHIFWTDHLMSLILCSKFIDCIN